LSAVKASLKDRGKQGKLKARPPKEKELFGAVVDRLSASEHGRREQETNNRPWM